MADDSQPEPKRPFLGLEKIEEEGEAAVRRQVGKLFDESMKNGGRVDFAALARNGPDVIRALFVHLSREAARRPDAAKAASAPVNTVRPVAKERTKASNSEPRLSRTQHNWRNLRTDAVDYRWRAFLWGAATTTATSLIAFLVVWLLKHL